MYLVAWMHVSYAHSSLQPTNFFILSVSFAARVCLDLPSILLEIPHFKTQQNEIPPINK